MVFSVILKYSLVSGYNVYRMGVFEVYVIVITVTKKRQKKGEEKNSIKRKYDRRLKPKKKKERIRTKNIHSKISIFFAFFGLKSFLFFQLKCQ